jgi:hypothetical protein
MASRVMIHLLAFVKMLNAPKIRSNDTAAAMMMMAQQLAIHLLLMQKPSQFTAKFNLLIFARELIKSQLIFSSPII